MKYKLAPGTQPSGLQSGTEEGWISTHQKGYHRCLTLSISAGWSYRHWQMGPHKDWNDAFSKYRTQLEEIKGIQEEVMWQKLVELDKGSCISTCNFDGRNGLVENHRYTLVHCVEVNGFKLVGLRNPWGHTEWKGAWSDQSEEWEAHPEVKEALKFTSEDDGLFWMDFADFYTKAGEVCCNVAPNPLPRHASLVVHR